MNKDNVQKAIKVIQRVVDQGRSFDMGSWQDDTGCVIQRTEVELHECGTAACFGGWVAVSPEFQADGGLPTDSGMPSLPNARAGSPAIATWLDISDDDANELTGIYVNLYWGEDPVDEHHTVTAQEVLDVLVRLRDTGSIWPQENQDDEPQHAGHH